MLKIKVFLIITVFVLLLNLYIPIYADDELEETAITQDEIEEILETTADITDIPVINSRNAVVYDRTSRRSTIWKTRKY